MSRRVFGNNVTSQEWIHFPVSTSANASSLVFAGDDTQTKALYVQWDDQNSKPDDSLLSEFRSKQYPLFVACLGPNPKLVQQSELGSFDFCSVSIPDNVERLSEQCFYKFKGLCRVIFGTHSSLKVIDAEAFNGCSLVEISIPDTVEDIGNKCFYMVKTLSQVRFGASSSLKRLGGQAFSQCSLTEITIPDSVEEIGEECFAYCQHLSSVNFGKSPSLKRIGRDAFSVSGLATIHIPDSVEELGENCFGSCKNLARATFGESSSLKAIGVKAFYNGGLTMVHIPDSVEDLCDKCFGWCFSLARVDLGKVKRIGSEAFWVLSLGSASKLLREVMIPDTVEEIGDQAFAYCTQLSSVTFGKCPSVKRIAYGAFHSCGLEEIMIPDTVETLGRDCFSDCLNLSRVIFGESPSLKSIGCHAFGHFSKGCPIEEIYIPDSVEEICEGSFQRCRLLSRVNFGKRSSLKVIGPEAFSACSMSEITIPDSVEKLRKMCFYRCKKLSRVNFGECSQLNFIGSMCFAFSGLIHFSIPANVSEVRGAAFAGSPMSNGLSCDANNRFSVLGSLLLTQDGTICLGHFGVLKEITIPDSVQEIAPKSFFRCKNLLRVRFGPAPQLKRIGSRAFSGNNAGDCSLTEIQFPDSLEEIGDECFMYCEELKPVKFGQSLKRIGKGAFQMWSTGKLKKIVIPRSVVEIGDDCFSGVGLRSIKFDKPSSIKRIGNGAFANAYIKTLDIPDTVEHLGSNCLCNSHWLTTVTFGKSPSLKYLSSETFICSGLTEITIPDSIEDIGDGCFSGGSRFKAIYFGPSPSVKRFGERAFSGLLGDSQIKEIAVPDSVEEICQECFTCCRKLERVIFGANSSLKRIGALAFGGEFMGQASPLKEMKFPDSLEEIGDRCFRNCQTLSVVRFSERSSLRCIGAQAFWNTGLEAVVLPDGVEQIGENAFNIEYTRFSEQRTDASPVESPDSQNGSQVLGHHCLVA